MKICMKVPRSTPHVIVQRPSQIRVSKMRNTTEFRPWNVWTLMYYLPPKSFSYEVHSNVELHYVLLPGVLYWF